MRVEIEPRRGGRASSVAHVAMGELADADAVFLRAARGPAPRASPPGFQSMLVTWSARPQMRRRVAVAVEAELHGERHGALGQRHLVDAAVAFDAADALGDVDVVAEEHVFGQHRHAMPVQRDIVARGSARTGASIGAPVQICEWQVMQVWVGGRPACGPSATRGVAIAAVDAELAVVMAVAERHRLRAADGCWRR